jgi:hypothetical protein
VSAVQDAYTSKPNDEGSSRISAGMNPIWLNPKEDNLNHVEFRIHGNKKIGTRFAAEK